MLSTFSFRVCSNNFVKVALSLCFCRSSFVSSILLSVNFSFFCKDNFNSRSKNNSFDFKSEFVFSKVLIFSLLELKLNLYFFIESFKLLILLLLKIFSEDSISSMYIIFSSCFSLNLFISKFFWTITIFIWLKKAVFIMVVSFTNFLKLLSNSFAFTLYLLISSFIFWYTSSIFL